VVSEETKDISGDDPRIETITSTFVSTHVSWVKATATSKSENESHCNFPAQGLEDWHFF